MADGRFPQDMSDHHNPYGAPTYGAATAPALSARPPGFSKLGIASFLIALFGAAIWVAVVVAAVAGAQGGEFDAESSAAMIVGLLAFGQIGISLFALVLGVVALFASPRKKLFAVLGICFSTGTLFTTAAMLVIGIAVG